MFTFTELLAQMEHHKDLLIEAEHQRQVRLAVSAQAVRKTERKAPVWMGVQNIGANDPCREMALGCN